MSLSNHSSNAIFNDIASRYDLVNSVLSFGLHHLWRIRMALALPSGTQHVLDLACGTGAVPLTLIKHRPDINHITGIDIAKNMLITGRRNLLQRETGKKISLLEGDALNIPFKSRVFDAVTIAFALRNVPDISRLLISAYRVLKPSGVFTILEFSRPQGVIPLLMYNMYLVLIIPLAGLFFTGNWAAYRHLGKSILEFPDTGRFIKILRQCGFVNVTIRPMALGAVTLYIVKK